MIDFVEQQKPLSSSGLCFRIRKLESEIRKFTGFVSLTAAH